MATSFDKGPIVLRSGVPAVPMVLSYELSIVIPVGISLPQPKLIGLLRLAQGEFPFQ